MLHKGLYFYCPPETSDESEEENSIRCGIKKWIFGRRKARWR